MSKNIAVLNENNQVVNIIIVNDDYVLKQNQIEYFDNDVVYIGGYYLDNYFYPIQPYASWTRNQGSWQPPTPMPVEGRWSWDEDTLSWIEIEDGI
jgi:hypothetical protein